MARPKKQSREPFWRSARNCWYVHHGSTTVRLSPDKDEAWRMWHAMMAKPPEQRPLPVGPRTPVVAILDAFLDWTQKNRAARTYEAYRAHLQQFAATLPAQLATADLKPHHVTRVMDARDDWSANTKHDFATNVQRAFNWAEGQGLIDRNPIHRVEKPGRETRELAVSPADYAEVMDAVKEPCVRLLLAFAWESGVRPQEIVKIEARHVSTDLKRVVLPPKEAKGKKRHRIVYLTDAGLVMLTSLLAERPAGPLFRNTEGEPWNKDSINCMFRRLRMKLAERMMERDGFPRPVAAKVPRARLAEARASRRTALVRWKERRLRYFDEKVPKFHLGAWRKGYATEAIKAGVDLSTLAGLLGHKDGRMLAAFYSKVTQDQEHMARAAEKAKRPPSEAASA